jgi:YfiH family protein
MRSEARALPGLQPKGLGLGVRAFMSTRAGGVSEAPFASLNLGRSVGDAPEAVAENRRRVAAHLRAQPLYLHQVHSARCLVLTPDMLDAEPQQADAAVTASAGLACVAQAADCLPVLFSALDAQGRALAVGSAHAGWRGLAAGVLEATVASLRQAAPGVFTVRAWLGPCIGPKAFEVGEDVLRAFGASPERPGPFFSYTPRADGSPRWRAHLQGLARQRLLMTGVDGITAETACTVSDSSRFFSFRRDGSGSGRMAAFIALGQLSGA